MTRRIVTVSPQAAAGGAPADNYAARIVKYVPADIVAAWLALVALLTPEDGRHRPVLWAVFGLLVVATPLWTLRATARDDRPPARMQAAISTLAFVVWVFATGPPFSWLSFYDPALGGTAIILFTVASGFLVPARDDRAAPPGSAPPPTGADGGR